MQVCVPVIDDRGLESRVCEHFGSAPAFMVVDTATGACRAIPNGHAHREHGACAPLDVLLGQGVEGFVVGGIGRGALARIEASGARAWLARPGTVAEVVAALGAGDLALATIDNACRGHGRAHGHHHDRDGAAGPRGR
jgi:predicted Fe-Mo cluster-binding NifX family protein